MMTGSDRGMISNERPMTNGRSTERSIVVWHFPAEWTFLTDKSQQFLEREKCTNQEVVQ